MLVVMNQGIADGVIENAIKYIQDRGFETHVSKGEVHTVIGVVGGGAEHIDRRDLELLEGVKEVIKITSSYKLVSRVFKPKDTVVKIGEEKFGGNNFGVIAGPCSVESLEQMDETAKKLSKLGVKVLRGGAFKPRTSPYAFQGLGEEGLQILRKVADKYNMAVVSEIMEIGQIPLFEKYVDCLQVGARNMQNFNLLKELSHLKKPILLKRGLSATFEEWLMSAEYIMSGGNRQIILCERGIRTFETATRNTLDLCAVPVIQKLSHLPIITDPSHGTGLRDKVAPMAKASIAAGADGVMLEVHHKPECALCDGAQSLTPEQLKGLLKEVGAIANVCGKKIIFKH